MDPAQDPGDTYLLEDAQLPLMVFGPLSLVKTGRPPWCTHTHLSA